MPRRLLLAPLTLLAVLALPAPASAVVTSSQVTSPASTRHAVLSTGTCRTADPSYRLVMSGTAAGLPGDQVDLRCAYRRAGRHRRLGHDVRRRDGVPVTARNVLPGRRPARAGRVPVVATPAGVQPADLTPFAGPRYFGAEREHDHGRRRPERGRRARLLLRLDPPDARRRLHEHRQRRRAVRHGAGRRQRRPAVLLAGALVRERRALRRSPRRPARRARSSRSTASTRSPRRGRQRSTPARATAVGPPVDHGRQRRLDQATGDVTHVSTEPFVTCPTDGGANVTARRGERDELRPLPPVRRRREAHRRAARRDAVDRDEGPLGQHRRHARTTSTRSTTSASARSLPAQIGYRFPWVDGSTFNVADRRRRDRAAAGPRRDDLRQDERGLAATTTRATRRGR